MVRKKAQSAPKKKAVVKVSKAATDNEIEKERQACIEQLATLVADQKKDLKEMLNLVVKNYKLIKPIEIQMFMHEMNRYLIIMKEYNSIVNDELWQ